MIQSPCINICKIDNGSGLCIGCCRNEYEVFNWINFSDTEKELILSKIKSRVKSNNDQNNNKSLFIESNPSPVKYAASLLKLSPDDVRLPLVNITEPTKQAVKDALQFANLI